MAYPITRPSTRRPPKAQAITLAAATITLVNSTPGANEVLLTGGVLAVTTTASNYVLKLPANTQVSSSDMSVEIDVQVTGTSPVSLHLKDNGGTTIAVVPPGGGVAVRHATTGPVALTPARAALATGDIDPITGMQFITVAAGAVNTDVAASKFTRAWQLAHAEFISDGATGGTVQVKTAAGAAAVSDAMVPGNAGEITRPASLANRGFAAASGLRIVGGGANPGGTMMLQWIPA